MSTVPRQKWIRRLLSSPLVRPPPRDLDQRQTEILAYVELFAQFASEAFGHDISELVRNHYPHSEASLLDDVLAIFILHHPEHGHAILHALLSCIIDRTVSYDKKAPPFGSFISLFNPSSECLQKDLSEQWALACGEILRVLTHYNRPISNTESSQILRRSIDNAGCESSSGSAASSHMVEEVNAYQDQERKMPTRFLTPWITDSLLAAPLGVKSDYFRWCGGVMGKYAAGGELKPPTTVGTKGPGKHPQLMPSTPRWAVANGAAVILSVCDDEVARYETADLTAAAVPALLLPPPATALDQHLVAGLPPLEPFARLFHRYYAIATPGATQRLFLGLLEAPLSWAPDALDAAVQLVELLRAAEDYNSSMQLPRNWLHLHFLRPVGAALAMRSGIAADAAAALLFRVFSQPALLFPPPGHAQDLNGVRQSVYGFPRHAASPREQMVIAAAKATEEATARGIASLMCDHGPDVEWQICTLWEAAYGLLPLNSCAANLPELVVAAPLQPPPLSWNLFRPLLRVLEYLPHGSASEACLLRIFTATVEVILHRSVPTEEHHEQRTGTKRNSSYGAGRFGLKHTASTELRAMVHALFTEACPSAGLAARLLSVAFTVYLSHDAIQQGIRKSKNSHCSNESEVDTGSATVRVRKTAEKERGAVSTFDSYVVAAVCALACEVQLLSLPATLLPKSHTGELNNHDHGGLNSLQNGVASAMNNAWRLLRLLEALLALVPQSDNVNPASGSSSGEIVAAAVVAAHISEVLGNSKACMHALSAIMRCPLEPKLSSKAASVLALVEGNRKVVAAAVDTVGVSGDPENMCTEASESCTVSRSMALGSNVPVDSSVTGMNACRKLQICNGCGSGGPPYSVNVTFHTHREKSLVNLPINASDVVSLLCMEKENGSGDNVGSFITTVLQENKDLSVAAVPLLCKKLISAPEVPASGEGTSAKRGWRQVVEALCNIVSVYPEKAASAIMFQVERDLQPWVDNADIPEFIDMWRVNKRIVCLLAELLRLHSAPEALIVVAKHSSIVEQATEGLSVDGEACTMPQLELLEAAADATGILQASNSIALESLLALLKRRLPAIVRCLSHNSAHVRALSMALLRNDVYSKLGCAEEKKKEEEWKLSVEQCFAREMRHLLAMGMSISMLIDAATSLGCCVSV